MATALDIITDAYLRIGVYAAGETLSDADAERALSVMNDMIDSWSNEALFCYANVEQSFVLVPGQQRYSVGLGGTINVPRPVKIRMGPGAAYIMDARGDVYDVEVIGQDSWNQIGLRTANSNLPDTMFYDPQYPLAFINIFPIPTTGYTIYFDAYLQLSDFTALSTVMSLPPGYKDALQKSLAIELWSYKPDGSEPPAWLQKLATEAKAAIKRINIKPMPAVFDAELLGRGQSSYNIYRGY